MSSPEGLSRRRYLGATGAVAFGAVWRFPAESTVSSLQAERPVEVDRTVGDLVVLPADPETLLTGVIDVGPDSDFSQSTELLVRLSASDGSVLASEFAEISETGEWEVVFDLADAEPGQPIEIEVTEDDEVTLVTVPGVIGAVTGSITFSNQEAVDEARVVVVVEDVYLEVGGFVAIYEESPAGPIRGVSEFLPAGTRRQTVEIQLEDPVEGETTLVAVAHVDSDVDRSFGHVEDTGVDPPYLEYGDPVFDEALVAGHFPPVTETTTRADDTGGLPPGLDVGVGAAGGLVGVWLLQKVRNPPGTGQQGEKPTDEDDRDTENRPPHAQIVSHPENPKPGHPVLFDGALSFDPDRGDHVVEYDWTIGESEPTGQRVVHVFGTPGEVDVTLTVTDRYGASGASTRTVTVQDTGGTLALSDAHPDAGGRDHEQLHDEFLTFENVGDAKLTLGQWTIHDAAEEEGRVTKGDHTFTIPSGVTLEPGATLTVHTGSAPPTDEYEETDSERHLFWNKRWPVWNNDADVVVVSDDAGHPVLATRYERTTRGAYEFEDITPASLVDWFPPVTVKSGDATTVGPVSLASEFEPTAVSNAVEFVASALFLRGTKQFVSSWALLTSFFLISGVTWLVSIIVWPQAQSIPLGIPLMLLLGSLVLTIAGEILVLLQRTIGSIVDPGG
ncbi:DUF7282 domain-containing protein [Haloarchaeobius sp. HRN-SO-5]|uniref:DUF7282 domain-containing protein n=1 Tax=Haloarchaeobius sp. HRN-SO-5 TaxID=3446118 RepID=UPI003EBE6C3C